jgi:hypothetical protein
VRLSLPHINPPVDETRRSFPAGVSAGALRDVLNVPGLVIEKDECHQSGGTTS